MADTSSSAQAEGSRNNPHVSRDAGVLRQLLTHVPDIVINCDHKKAMPHVSHFSGVCLFADISGFTSLCETYGNLAKSDVKFCGTEKLTLTLNTYIGKIVEGVLRNGGDVLKFAGDALLALWKLDDSTSDVSLLINKAIICSLAIQEECDNYMTDVKVLLRVKIAIAFGKMHITYIGLTESKQFDLSGPAVDEVNAAEKWAEPGTVIVSRQVWAKCDQSLFLQEILEDGLHYKVLGVRVEEASTNITMATKTGVVLSLMSGVLTTKATLLSTPTVGKRIVGPHTGAVIKKFYPEQKLDRIYRKKKDKAGEEAKEKICQITGKLLKSASFHDPDHRTDIYNVLNDHEIKDMRAYIPKPVLSKIDHGQDLEWLSEMRQVSVLFINMVLPRKGQAASEALQKAFEVIHECVRRLRGNLNKVFSFDKGCTFLVIFGLPGDKHEDDQARALKAGHKVLDLLHQVMEITNESIGIATGRAFCGVVGHRERHEYTVIGRKVNMSARLMVNYPHVLSCDDETYRAAKTKLKKEDFVILPFKPLKGIADPGVVREYNKHHDREVEEEDYAYPILGRQKEIEVLQALLRTVKTDDDSRTENPGHLLFLEGEGGIGKSRVLEEYMDIAEDEDFRVDYVEADMAHAHTPYYIVESLIKILLEMEDCRTPAEVEHAVREHITDKSLREDLCLLNDLLGIHIPPNPKFSHMDSELVTKHFHKLLFGIVHQFAVGQPCLFAVDNAQFIDQESWDFLEDLAQDSHAVLILALRPFSSSNPPCKAAVRLMNHKISRKLKLDGLSEELMSDLACHFMDVMQIPKELDNILRTKSHGVASWCEQLIKDMLVSNVIQIVPEGQAFAKTLTDLDPPQPSNNSTGNISRCNTPFYATESTIFERDEETSVARRRSSTPVTPRHRPGDRIRADSSGRARRRSTGTPKTLPTSFEEGNLSDLHRKNEATNREPQNTPVSFLNEPDASAKNEKQLFHLDPNNFVHAAEGAMPFVTGNVCIITPGVDISEVLVPDSVKDMVLARVDRMMPVEQVALKCSSILGTNIDRNLLEYLLPSSSRKDLDLVLYNLAKEGILECASLANQHQSAHNHHGFYDYNDPIHGHHHANHHHHHHHHNVATILHAPVLCGCYADEVTKVINLTRLMTPNGPKKHCMCLKFANTFMQETMYALWLEDQKRSLHERAAMFLESQAHKCRSCGGGGFVPGQSQQREDIPAGGNTQTAKKVSGVSGRSLGAHTSLSNKRRKTIEMRDKVQSQGAFSARAHERGGIETQDLSRERQLLKRETLSSAATSDQIRGDRWRSWVGKCRRGVEQDPSHRITENKRLSLKGRKKSLADRRIPTTVEEEEDFDDQQEELDEEAAPTVDLSQCQCAEVLASVFPQLVEHWRAAGNTLKTARYLTESGAAALATSANMQALSYLSEVKKLFQEENRGNEVVSEEEKARVDSLIGQALFHMNRLDESLSHLLEALKLLGKKQPTTDFGCHWRILRETVRHYLHVFLPGYYIEAAGENSSRFIEQARCLSHLSHVYHALHENTRSLMAAVQELNAAEEAEENLHELITAYASVVECTHLVGWTSWGKRYENVGLARCEDPSLELSSENLVTVGHLHCVSLTFRLAIGDLSAAIDSGRHAVSTAKKVHDLHMKVTCTPILAQALLLTANIEDCRVVLRELRQASKETEDYHGEALYMCCCFDLILETGEALEDIDSIIQYILQTSADPAFAADVIPKFYLNASLALWYARKREWEKAEACLATAVELEPTSLEVIMSVHGFVKIVEYRLLQLGTDPTDKILKSKSKKALQKLKGACKLFPVFKPRREHLKAYLTFLCGRTRKAKKKLKKCLELSMSMGLKLEAQWSLQNKAHWFSSTQDLPNYGERCVFVLPKRPGL